MADIEKYGGGVVVDEKTSPTIEYSGSGEYEYGVVEQQPTGWIGKLNKFVASMNAEVRGIERIPEEEQTDDSYWTTGSMWLGCNMVIATVALGVLGITVFGLDFWSAFLTIVFFNLLGSQTVCFFSTFGPEFGLRQMVISRFWFGAYTIKFPAFINLVACIGWTAVNTIVSAQLLNSINNGALPAWAGCLIITLITLCVTFFGYKVVHAFEKWAWIPNLIIFVIIAVRLAKSKRFTYGEMGSGPTTAGNVLSFGATIYGFATGWTSLAADYTSYKPKNTSKWGIYFSVLVGLNFPLMFAMILGAAMATGTLSDPAWAESYANNSVGGLFHQVLVKDSLHGFGSFCIVVLALSTVSNNTPNLYSLGLTAQTFWEGLRKVPRAIWTVAGSGVSLAICIPGYMYFEDVMHNFMNMIGYWLAIYTAISVSDHIVFRKGFKGYVVDDFDKPNKLPPGIAAGFAFACGAAGVCIGMSQKWWTGPLAKKIGEFGGDIGFELGFGFALVTYLCTRPLEKSYFKR